MAKQPAKKKATPKKAVAKAVRSVIDLRPTAKDMAAAERCLQRSGKIVIGFKEVSVTKLPKTISPELTFND